MVIRNYFILLNENELFLLHCYFNNGTVKRGSNFTNSLKGSAADILKKVPSVCQNRYVELIKTLELHAMINIALSVLCSVERKAAAFLGESVRVRNKY